MFRLAVIQPLTHRPPDDEKNVAEALDHIRNAASQGADVIAFPESYPGPWRMPAAFDPTELIAEAAREHQVYVQFGTLEPIDSSERMAYSVLKLARPEGGEPGKYRRTHPPGPWIYAGGDWDFEYQAGDDYPVFATPHGTFGLAMCSEAYMPEVTRALALRGAECIFMPAGTDKRKLWSTWRNLIWARAIENLAAVITTQNMFSSAEMGLAMVAMPEEIIFESTRPGMFVLEIDLERLREMRSSEDRHGSSKEYGAKPGVLTQWQRPEMFDKLHPYHRPG